MQVRPKTEEQINDQNIWPVGEYAFKIMSAEEKQASTGKIMIELKVRVEMPVTGRVKIIYDRLLDETPLKTRHACKAMGVLAKYDTGVVDAADFPGKTGLARVGVQQAKGHHKSKNVIEDYLSGSRQLPPADDVLGRYAS